MQNTINSNYNVTYNNTSHNNKNEHLTKNNSLNKHGIINNNLLIEPNKTLNSSKRKFTKKNSIENDPLYDPKEDSQTTSPNIKRKTKKNINRNKKIKLPAKTNTDSKKETELHSMIKNIFLEQQPLFEENHPIYKEQIGSAQEKSKKILETAAFEIMNLKTKIHLSQMRKKSLELNSNHENESLVRNEQILFKNYSLKINNHVEKQNKQIICLTNLLKQFQHENNVLKKEIEVIKQEKMGFQAPFSPKFDLFAQSFEFSEINETSNQSSPSTDNKISEVENGTNFLDVQKDETLDFFNEEFLNNSENSNGTPKNIEDMLFDNF